MYIKVTKVSFWSFSFSVADFSLILPFFSFILFLFRRVPCFGNINATDQCATHLYFRSFVRDCVKKCKETSCDKILLVRSCAAIISCFIRRMKLLSSGPILRNRFKHFVTLSLYSFLHLAFVLREGAVAIPLDDKYRKIEYSIAQLCAITLTIFSLDSRTSFDFQ